MALFLLKSKGRRYEETVDFRFGRSGAAFGFSGVDNPYLLKSLKFARGDTAVSEFSNSDTESSAEVDYHGGFLGLMRERARARASGHLRSGASFTDVRYGFEMTFADPDNSCRPLTGNRKGEPKYVGPGHPLG